MKKNYLGIVAGFACLGALLFSATACNFFATDPDGRTTYDVAVSNGYEGTRESWLAQVDGASSKERQWYEEACAAGEFEGTFAEFLKSIGAGEGDGTVAANTALLSVVSIYSFFQTSYMMGSGVIYSLDKSTGEAYILTNYHCVYSVSEKTVSNKINLYFYGNEDPANANIYSTGNICATYVGCAEDYDIAVLKVTDDDLRETPSHAVPFRAVEAGDSDAVTVGQSVFAVGNALGKGLTATKGVVSVEREEIVTHTVDGTKRITMPEIRTDAAINHGNSGGGLFNMDGKLVGVVNARLDVTQESTSQDENVVAGIGYAIPANLALGLVQSIIDNGGTCYTASLGFEILVPPGETLFDEKRAKFYTEERIILNYTTYMGGAGYTAGMRNGDTLISASILNEEGTPVSTVVLTQRHKLDDLLLKIRLNDTVRFVVSRSGVELTFDLNFVSNGFFNEIE